MREKYEYGVIGVLAGIIICTLLAIRYLEG